MRAALLCLTLLCVASGARAESDELVLWHSYRGAEETALLQSVDAFVAANPSLHVTVLGQPNEGFASKLNAAIPRGNGPDLFVFAHERVGGWSRAGLIAPLDGTIDPEVYLPEALAPLQFEGKTWGWPLAVKSVALFYVPALLPVPPKTTDELVAASHALKARGVFGLAYPTDDFFFHAAWFFGFGGTLFGEDGKVAFETRGAIDSFAFVRGLTVAGLVPEEPNGALVTQLFHEGKAASVISGPWFLGELKVEAPAGLAAPDGGPWWRVAPLPIVSATGKPAAPFLTAEALFLNARAKSPEGAKRLAAFLAGPVGAKLRGDVGRQIVAAKVAWEEPAYASDPVIAAFRAQLPSATPTPGRPEMANVWEPAKLALKKAVRGEATPEEAARAAQRRLAAITRPPPPGANELPYVILVAAAILGALALFGRWMNSVRKRGALGASARGFLWVAPAVLSTAVLVFAPFAVGLGMSLFDHREGRWSFVGFANFFDILSAKGYALFEPLSFWYALAVTVLWTAVNLAIHVILGVTLALLLDQPLGKLRAVWRVLLVVPWAVPSYITALVWKGMFHKQYGAINGLLEACGVGGIAWFSEFGTAFFANVCANAWLGFPFMMVVTLGALQSIPKDLYEAADVDGAGFFQKLRHVTVPLLKPALVPAILLGTVWTFNQFNVVYLVSSGEPDNATDILISEAYRWAFARQEQYGYAAAYAALIFVLLFGWSRLSGKIARSVEAGR